MRPISVFAKARLKTTIKVQSGVTLIECLVAILIFSLGILGMIGLQAAAIRNTMEADYRVKASYLANQIIATMWADRTNLANYDTTSGGANAKLVAWKGLVSTTLPDASATSANPPTISVVGTQVDVTVNWQKAGESTPHSFNIRAYINGPT